MEVRCPDLSRSCTGGISFCPTSRGAAAPLGLSHSEEIQEGAEVMPGTKQEAPDTARTMHVVNHIRSLMENGALQPGDKIPPEREFARALKVGRATLRTGIGYLAAMGVMKVRHGVGTFVPDGPPEFAKASLSLLSVLHGFQSWQVFEARLILESSLAELAAERGKEEHHTAL